MNLFVGFAILLTLACSELNSAAPVEELPVRLALIALTAFFVPTLALFQTMLVKDRLSSDDMNDDRMSATLGRLSACHTAVWLAASLAMIVTFRWHEVVRNNWQLDQIPLIDELVILAPMMLALVASWAVFFEFYRQNDHHSSPSRALWFTRAKAISRWLSKDRIEFVRLRFQLQILVVALPILLVVLVHDVSQWLEDPGWRAAMLVAMMIVGLVGFPFVLSKIWPTHKLSSSLAAGLNQELGQHGLSAAGVYRWETGGRMINACVMGVVPGTRRILLSDRLLDLFNGREVAAVVRHELGHVRRRHAGWRILFSLLPLLSLVVWGRILIGTWFPIELACERLGIVPSLVWSLLSAGYLLYLLFLLRWISRSMEFEADLFAGCRFNAAPRSCGTELATRHQLIFDPQRLSDMAAALLRLAAYHPAAFERGTWLYPSLATRIERLNQVPLDRPANEEFGRLERSRWVLAALLAAAFSLLSWQFLAFCS